jgi:putative ABC transport system permease protein
MLLKDFLKLVGLAILIATPVSWLLMQKWLENYAYRVNMHWWVFGISAFAAILISFFTISYQSIKAANTNPTKSLRIE